MPSGSDTPPLLTFLRTHSIDIAPSAQPGFEGTTANSFCEQPPGQSSRIRMPDTIANNSASSLREDSSSFCTICDDNATLVDLDPTTSLLTLKNDGDKRYRIHRAEADAPLHLLCLDGGGIRGIVQLLVLKELMGRVKELIGASEMPLPCDYFHIIGGSGTGGLNSILLGRMRMSVEDAITSYCSISRATFGRLNHKLSPKKTTYRVRRLVDSFCQVVTENNCGSEDMYDCRDGPDMGRSLVCATPLNSSVMGQRTHYFRSYVASTDEQSPSTQMTDVLRATMACIPLFKDGIIYDGIHQEQVYRNNPTLGNNPTGDVIEEALRVFGGSRRVATIVNLGTATLARHEKPPNAFKKIQQTVRDIERDCVESGQVHESQCARFPDTFHRFDPWSFDPKSHFEECVSDVDLRVVVENTRHYLVERRISQQLENLAQRLAQNESLPADLATLDMLCSFTSGVSSQPLTRLDALSSDSKIGLSQYQQELTTRMMSLTSSSAYKRSIFVHGDAGVGKTEIVLAYLKRVQRRVFWIDGSSRHTIDWSLRRYCMSDEANALGVVDAADSALTWITHLDEDWVYVLDNISIPEEEISKFIPSFHPATQGFVVLVRRQRFLSTIGRIDNPILLDVKCQTPSEYDMTRLIPVIYRKDFGDPLLLLKFRNIGETLKFPFAISIAASSIFRGLYSVETYLGCFREMQQSPDGAISQGLLDALPSDYERVVYVSCELCYHKLQMQPRDSGDGRASLIAMQLLDLLAFFNHEYILEETFRRAALQIDKARRSKSPFFEQSLPVAITELGDADLSILKIDKHGFWDPFLFREGVRVLCSLSLMKSRQANIYSLEPTVQAWIRHRQSASARAHNFMLARTILAYSTELQGSMKYHHKIAVLHLKAVSACALNFAVAVPFFDDIDPRIATAYSANGDFMESTALWNMVMEERRSRNGHKHSVHEAKFHLALAHFANRDYTIAGVHFDDVLVAQKQGLSMYHPFVTESVRHLGIIFRRAGLFENARKKAQLLLDIYKDLFLMDHPKILDAKENLGHILVAETSHIDAERLLHEVLTERKRLASDSYHSLVGNQDEMVRTSTLSYAYALKFLDRLHEAEELEQGVLYVREAELGPRHPLSLQVRQALMQTAHMRGKLGEAEELCRQIISAKKMVLPWSHPIMASLQDSLVCIWKDRGRLGRAEMTSNMVIQTRKSFLSTDRYAVLMSDTYRAQLDVRLRRFDRVVGTVGEYLGIPDERAHAVVLSDLNLDDPAMYDLFIQLAIAYKGKGDLPLSIEIQKAILGRLPQGQRLMSRWRGVNRLTDTLRRAERFEEALRLSNEVLREATEILGQTHRVTLSARTNIGLIYGAQDKWGQASECFEQVLDAQRKQYGDEARPTWEIMHHLAVSYRHLQRYGEAFSLEIFVSRSFLHQVGIDDPDIIRSIFHLAEMLVGNRSQRNWRRLLVLDIGKSSGSTTRSLVKYGDLERDSSDIRGICRCLPTRRL